MFKPPKKEHDYALMTRALTNLSLRVAVAGYMVYLAWKIMSGTQNGGTNIPVWGVWLICIIFVLAALAFCFYAWKLYLKALKAAEIHKPQKMNETDEVSNQSK